MTEKTCNQFIKEMKLAGFTFKYRATDGKQVFTGEVKAVKENTPCILRKVNNEQ